MNSKAVPQAGQLPDPASLVNIPALVTAYYNRQPDVNIAEQRVSFGTSGHRGNSLTSSFNEAHILAVCQAVSEYRTIQGITGPLFLGFDTHALSTSAFGTALEVLAANSVELMIAPDDEYTPTPAISHAIIVYNRKRSAGFADGIVITPSHNPPDSGGIKYNPPNGGPADTLVTKWIQERANALLADGLRGVARITEAKARSVSTTHLHNYVDSYVGDLGSVVDMKLISDTAIPMGVGPLGGAGVNYWGAIAERYRLNLTVVNQYVDPTFRFMTLDWDGKIRMDPSSSDAMQSLIGLKDKFAIAFACDTDHDRHGIVTPSGGLMPPNHYLAVCIDYLFRHRPDWSAKAAIGKTVVSSQMIDRVCASLGRRLYEVPVGFKWFVEGLNDGSLGFGGEESAGASFLRMDGSAWTTDKDGLIPALLAAEMTAHLGPDPSQLYEELGRQLGTPVYDRIDAAATVEQKQRLASLKSGQVRATELAGEKITGILSHAPGNGAAIGGLKIMAESGWFAARPSGTEDIYKIYAESFRSADHLSQILDEAQSIVGTAMEASAQ